MPQDDVTQLPEIVVTGQRRKDETYSFPSPPDPPPPIVDEIGPDDGSSDHPCGTAEGAREWNTDARIAAGLRQMQDDADDPLLDARERSIVVAYNPTTGETYVGNMLVGEPFQGEVGFDLTGIDPAHIIGLMHSHPGSGPYPSGPDRDLFIDFQGVIEDAGGDPSKLKMYMVGARADAGGSSRIQIRVYDQTNIDGDEQNPGPEVNPNATPCP